MLSSFSRRLFLLGILIALMGCRGEAPDRSARTARSLPDTIQTLDYKIRPEVVATDLESPWAIDFLSDDSALVTEQPGRLRLLIDGTLEPDSIRGIPEVLYEGVQGGLLDVAVDPEYDRNGWIYLSYAHGLPAAAGEKAPAMTRVVRGRIRNHTWQDQEVLFEAPHDTYRPTRHHFGSRIVFDPQGRLYVSIGDRGDWPLYPDSVMMQAQQLDRPNGKIHRLHRDGSIPNENPFVGRDEALPSIYTLGHRNPQGLAVHPETGRVWALEHGPRGGDELNLLRSGQNYGWPEITYGINYDGSIITRERRKQGMEQPIAYWRPSIAASGLSFYRGDDFPYWQHQLLASTLKAEELRLLTLHEDRVMHQEIIFAGAGPIREAVPGPEGAIYIVFEPPPRIVRLTHLADVTARK